jgi:mono/diheme cytochrome c family protein
MGPFFLDTNMMPAPTANASTASGWALYFDVPSGQAAITQAANATVTITMAVSPINPATVTLATAVVKDGAPPALPTNVSFAQTVVPIFSARGCVACHSGNGAGKDIGGLQLNGGNEKIYSELVTERLNTRVIAATPATSLVLTMPSRETPPDNHPNITFASAQDPDYVKILVWITEGAKNN